MPVQQSDLLADVRSRLDESTARFWTDAELIRWINEGLRVVARRTETLEDAETTLQSIAGGAKYALPAACQRVHRVEFAPSSASIVYPMELKSYYEMDELWGTQQLISRSYPSYAVFWGAPPNIIMQVYPVPSQMGTFNIFYYRLPKALAGASDVADISEGWHDLVVLYCEYVALRKDRDDRWQDAKTLFEEGLNQMVDVSRRHHDQGGSFVNRGFTTMSDLWEM